MCGMQMEKRFISKEGVVRSRIPGRGAGGCGLHCCCPGWEWGTGLWLKAVSGFEGLGSELEVGVGVRVGLQFWFRGFELGGRLWGQGSSWVPGRGWGLDLGGGFGQQQHRSAGGNGVPANSGKSGVF